MKELFDYLEKKGTEYFLTGSRYFRINKDNSDYDVVYLNKKNKVYYRLSLTPC